MDSKRHFCKEIVQRLLLKKLNHGFFERLLETFALQICAQFLRKVQRKEGRKIPSKLALDVIPNEFLEELAMWKNL